MNSQITENKLGGDQGEIVALGVENSPENGTQGEVGVSLKKFFFFKGDSFSFCHHTNASCSDNLLALHSIFLPFNCKSMCNV